MTDEDKINQTLNESIAFLTPDQIHLTDELPKVLILDRTTPNFEFLFDTQINTLIN